jgi:hypothetical protein
MKVERQSVLRVFEIWLLLLPDVRCCTVPQSLCLGKGAREREEESEGGTATDCDGHEHPRNLAFALLSLSPPSLALYNRSITQGKEKHHRNGK